MVKTINLGESLSFQCPKHEPSYGVAYTWEGSKNSIQFSRKEHRAISPYGALYIMYVMQEDIDEINEKNGIRCQMSGANSYRESGTLKLTKNNPTQSGNE